jgi:hypothetical protein
MPRLDALQQQTRLQVTSPVTYQSPGAARVQGEAVQGLGNDLIRAGLTLQQFKKESKDAERRIIVGQIREAAAAEKYKAFVHSQTTSKNPDGSDRIDVYGADFDNRTKGFTDGVIDPEIKAEAQIAIANEKNSMLDNVVSSAMKKRIEYMQSARDSTVGQRNSNVFSNPYTVMDAIKATDDELSQSSDIYSPSEIPGRKQEEKKALAMAAVNGLIDSAGKAGPDGTRNSGRVFNDARVMVMTDLKEFLGPDVDKVRQMITDEEVKYQNREMELNYRAKQAAAEAKKIASDQFYLKSMVALDENPSKAPQIRKQFIQAAKMGIVDPVDYSKGMNEFDTKKSKELSSTAMKWVDYITSEKSLVGINEKITKDVMVNGLMTTSEGKMVMLLADTKERARRNKKDPSENRDLKEAINLIKASNGGFQNDLGEFVVPGSKVKINSEMIFEFNALTRQGMKARPAVRQILKQYGKQALGTDYIDTKFFPKDKQTTLENFNAYKPTFGALVNKLSTGSAEDKKRASQLKKQFLQREEALKRDLELQKQQAGE